MRLSIHDESPYTVTYPSDDELYNKAMNLWDEEDFAGRVDLTFFTTSDTEYVVASMQFRYWNPDDLEKIERLVERARTL